MKYVRPVIFTLFLVMSMKPGPARAQEFEIKQLLLNVEKLAQLKQILQDMYKGYEIFQKGYTAIKDISEGNFSIHKVFLDGLLAVSPTVQKYKRVADIVNCQMRIIKQYKAAYSQFKNDKNFAPGEIEYIGNVYANFSELCLKNLDDLITVITAGKLRMSDDERITAIDRIYADIMDEYSFLQHFNNSAKLLSLARTKEQRDVDISRAMSGIK